VAVRDVRSNRIVARLPMIRIPPNRSGRKQRPTDCLSRAISATSLCNRHPFTAHSERPVRAEHAQGARIGAAEHSVAIALEWLAVVCTCVPRGARTHTPVAHLCLCTCAPRSPRSRRHVEHPQAWRESGDIHV
jgi:hypothetical protein